MRFAECPAVRFAEWRAVRVAEWIAVLSAERLTVRLTVRDPCSEVPGKHAGDREPDIRPVWPAGAGGAPTQSSPDGWGL